MDMNNLVVDMNINELLMGIGSSPMPEGHPAVGMTIRKAWELRDSIPVDEHEKIKILMDLFSNMTLQDMHDLRSRYNNGGLTPEEGKKVAAIKAAMQ